MVKRKKKKRRKEKEKYILIYIPGVMKTVDFLNVVGKFVQDAWEAVNYLGFSESAAGPLALNPGGSGCTAGRPGERTPESRRAWADLGRGPGEAPGRSGKLYRARSRLYRSQNLQVNMRLRALAEIYTMHSFAQI